MFYVLRSKFYVFGSIFDIPCLIFCCFSRWDILFNLPIGYAALYYPIRWKAALLGASGNGKGGCRKISISLSGLLIRNAVDGYGEDEIFQDIPVCF